MKNKIETLKLDRMIYGGQAIGRLESGKKALVWGGLPGETVEIQLTKKKSSYVEGIVTKVLEPSEQRILPRDPESYLSTSPWQIMDFASEQHYKAALIEEAFELHDIVLPQPISVYSDDVEYHYRNKVEFSWYGDTIDGVETLDLAFFRRGSKGKIVVYDSALLPESIMQTAVAIRDKLRELSVDARKLKTLLIRCDSRGNTTWQLYVKDRPCEFADELIKTPLSAQGGEVIYSDPRSPASVITERLAEVGDIVLTDTVLGVPFRYAIEGFFQVNLAVYEQALKDMRQWIEPDKSVVDMYSGVGSIGLTISGDDVTLVEVNEHAVREMRRNIKALGREGQATAVLAASEKALDYIDSEATIIVDPPRAGLHDDVIAKLLETAPARIVYLSCNPATQARDVAKLAAKYGIRHHQAYNFFPRTPHIENLVVLDLV